MTGTSPVQPTGSGGISSAAPAPGAQPRVAVFVDYENVYYADPRQFGAEGIRRLAEDLMLVAGQCGPVTVARAVAPFDRMPGAVAPFREAGFEAVISGGQLKNEADLAVVKELMSAR